MHDANDSFTATLSHRSYPVKLLVEEGSVRVWGIPVVSQEISLAIPFGVFFITNYIFTAWVGLLLH